MKYIEKNIAWFLETLSDLTSYKKQWKPYCVSCKKKAASKNSSARKTRQIRLMLLSNCAVSS